MFSKIRRRFTYANVAMTLALVFAMAGGAYAAGKYVITSTKQISPKVLKSLTGKAGPTGASGATGAVGPTGPAGPTGPVGKGETGPQGPEGKEGKAGKNGTNGTSGFTEALPTGKTETGTWSVTVPAQFRCVADSGKGEWEDSGCLTGAQEEHKGNFEQEAISHLNNVVFAPISFNIPLAPVAGEEAGYVLGEKAVHFDEEGTTDCPGTVAEPSAAPGNLCVYARLTSGVANDLIAPPNVLALFLPQAEKAGAGSNGAEVLFELEPGTHGAIGYGSWAVTAG
jgi:hypothetical protein